MFQMLNDRGMRLAFNLVQLAVWQTLGHTAHHPGGRILIRRPLPDMNLLVVGNVVQPETVLLRE